MYGNPVGVIAEVGSALLIGHVIRPPPNATFREPDFLVLRHNIYSFTLLKRIHVAIAGKMSNDAPENTESQPPAQNGLSQGRDGRPGPNYPYPIPPGPEPGLPSRKDVSLREFLHKIDDYAPIVRFYFSSFRTLFLEPSHGPREH